MEIKKTIEYIWSIRQCNKNHKIYSKIIEVEQKLIIHHEYLTYIVPKHLQFIELVLGTKLKIIVIYQNASFHQVQRVKEIYQTEQRKIIFDKLMEPDIYEVEAILSKRFTPNKGIQYLVQWMHYPNSEDFTWQPEEHLENVKDVVREFNDKYKYKREKKEKNVTKSQPLKPIQMEIQQDYIIISSAMEPQEQLPQPKKQQKTKVLPNKNKSKLTYSRLKKPKITPLPEPEPQPEQDPSKQIRLARKIRVKDDKGHPKPEAVSKIPQSTQPIPSYLQAQPKWYMTGNYHLGDICQHFFHPDNQIKYGVEVLDQQNRLICMVEISSQQMQRINIEKQKSYFENNLNDLNQQGTNQELQAFWQQ